MCENQLPSFYQAPSSRLTLTAKGFFAVTVILIPVRFRWIILTRLMPPLFTDTTSFFLYAVDAAMIITLLFWAASFISQRRKISLGSRHIWIPLAGLTVAGWISVIPSFDRALSIYHAIRLVLLFWFYLFIVNEIRSFAWILVPVSILVASQAVIAIGQSLTQSSLGLQSIGEHGLDPSVSGISIVTANGVRFLRAYGLSDHPNILGGCLAFGMLLLFSAYVNSPRQTPVLAALLPGFPALLVTFSRSAWLALLAGGIFIMVVLIISHHKLQPNRLIWLCISSLFMLSPFMFADARFLGARLDVNNSFDTPSVEQQSIGERFLLVNSTIPIFLTHPFFGVGLGAAPRALEIALPNFPVGYEPPHFALFDAALETGLLGAAFYLTLLVSPFVIFFRQRAILLSNPMATTAVALLLSTTIVGLFDYYIWLHAAGRVWQWMAWGLWIVAYTQKNSQQQNPFPIAT